MTLDFNENKLTIDSITYELKDDIKVAKQIGDLIIVIFEMRNAPQGVQYQNCSAFNETGEWIWTAEHPTTLPTDYYLNFMNGNKLWTFACYICEIDFKSGKLLNAKWTK